MLAKVRLAGKGSSSYYCAFRFPETCDSPSRNLSAPDSNRALHAVATCARRLGRSSARNHHGDHAARSHPRLRAFSVDCVRSDRRSAYDADAFLHALDNALLRAAVCIPCRNICFFSGKQKREKRLISLSSLRTYCSSAKDDFKPMRSKSGSINLVLQLRLPVRPEKSREQSCPFLISRVIQ